VLPVKFVLHAGLVMFRTAPGTRLSKATTAAVVAFEVDHYGDTTAPYGWSVLMRGVAHQITHPAELAATSRLPLESWDADPRADRIVKIEPIITTGRRITAGSRL